MSDLNSTIPLIIGVDHGFEVRVADEIVLPGGPHPCILGTEEEISPGYDILNDYTPLEVRVGIHAFYPHFIDPMPWIDDILSVIIADPRSTQNMIRYPTRRGSDIHDFLKEIRKQDRTILEELYKDDS